MAIVVYAGDAADFSANGLGVLRPTRCVVSQTAGGAYELEMTHPVTTDNRWALIQRGCIIKAPTPQAETPKIEIYQAQEVTTASPERVIWKVNITTQYAYGYSRIYQKPSTSAKVLEKLPEGAEYEYLGRYNGSWHKAVSAKGVSGYMWTANSQYVRTEAEVKPQAASPGWSTVVKPRQVREQLFRVVDTKLDTDKMEVQAIARHVSYDLLKNVVTRYQGESVATSAALEGLAANLVAPYDGEFYTDIAQSVSVDWQVKNGVAALLDPDEGLLYKATPRARLVRDNWDWFLLAPKTVNRGLTLRYGKNLLGVSHGISAENAATRIVPYGENKEGGLLLLPEVYVDSAQLSSYPVILAAGLEVTEAKEKEATEDDPGMSLEACYQLMREEVRKAFDKGLDGLDVTLEVSFLHLGDTVEYAAYKDLQQAYLYDTVTVIEDRVGLETTAEVIAYAFDAILERYEGMTLGRLGQVEKESIASFQLPTGGVAGSKLALGSVVGNRLRDLSVSNAKLGNASITYAKIASATIELLQADSIRATVAEIKKVITGEVTTNELYANIIEAVSAEISQVTAGEIATNALYAQIIKAVALEVGKLEAGELYADIIAASVAELQKVSAGSIETNDLYAEIVKAIRADLERITAGEIETSELYAILGKVVNLTAGSADIDFARIKDLISGDTIFTRGQGEELYVARLAVTESNMLSLTVGQLVVKGEDGRYYQLVVDPETEAGFSLREVQMDGDQLVDNTVSGGKIIENSITARELNAEVIFADEAIIREILAGYGKFGDVEAINGFIATLETQLIKSQGLKVLVKDDIDSLSTELNARTGSLEVRVQETENGLSELQTGVVVEPVGVTIRQPNQTDNTLVLKAGSMTINAPGREALVISQDESYMPSLRVRQFTMGNLVTTVSGSGQDCRVVEQYVAAEAINPENSVLGKAILGQMVLGEAV